MSHEQHYLADLFTVLEYKNPWIDYLCIYLELTIDGY